MPPRTYKTRQRDAIAAYLAANADRYLSVDDVWAGVAQNGARVRRTTVYRSLEALVGDEAQRYEVPDAYHAPRA